MNKRYLIYAALLILLALVLVFIPPVGKTNEIRPVQLLEKINDRSRFISADEVAERIIEKDPSLQLVDVRGNEEFTRFNLPGAVNIPVEQLPDSGGLEQLSIEGVEVVFYSNADLTADQAWIICSRLGVKNARVLKGGLHAWYETILQPVEPPSTAPSEELDLYLFRLAASQYFLGVQATVTPATVPGEPVEIVRKKKKTVSEGGC